MEESKYSDKGDATSPPPYRPVSALQCRLAYATALFAGAAAWIIFSRYGIIENPFWVGFAVTCISTGVIWIFSIANGNSSIYDPYWVIAPPILFLALKAASPEGIFGPWHARQAVILGCLVLWAGRYHIFYPWSGWRTGLIHEDWRYEDMRNAPVPYWLNSLGGMHLFPTVLVYFAVAPGALVVLTPPGSQPAFGVWDLLGAAGAVTAVAIQLIADRRMALYRVSEEYLRGGTLRSGLWKYSRHPNYFGEVLFWVSMLPFAAGGDVLARWPLLTVIGPVLMAVFFRFSCRLTDVRSLARRPGYGQVMKEVSALVPLPPRTRRRDHRIPSAE